MDLDQSDWVFRLIGLKKSYSNSIQICDSIRFDLNMRVDKIEFELIRSDF